VTRRRDRPKGTDMAEADAELLLDPAVQADPFPYYQQLRTEQPVLRLPGTGFYVLTRYEDLRAEAEAQHYPADVFAARRSRGRRW
jgi:hypothetical protein